MEISLRIEMPALAHLPDFCLAAALIAAGLRAPLGPGAHRLRMETLLRTGASWDGAPYAACPPEKTALRISIPLSHCTFVNVGRGKRGTHNRATLPCLPANYE